MGGLVFGLLFLNSAAAIVVSFALPIAFSILTSLIHSFHKVQPWVDLRHRAGSAAERRAPDRHRTGHACSRPCCIWVVIPFIVGMWRVLRAEVK